MVGKSGWRSLLCGILLGLVGSLLSGCEEKSGLDVLYGKIRKTLPDNWRVERKGAAIVIMRSEAVYLWFTINTPRAVEPGAIPENAVVENFRIALRLEKTDAGKEEREWKENLATRKKMKALHARMIESGMVHKFGSFIPRIDEERKMVRAYEALKASLSRLPDYHYGEYSVYYSDSCGPGGAWGVHPLEVEEECVEVAESITKLLRPAIFASTDTVTTAKTNERESGYPDVAYSLREGVWAVVEIALPGARERRLKSAATRCGYRQRNNGNCHWLT